MPDAGDFLYAGSAAQRAAVGGIVDHAYEKHGNDVPDSSPREFGAAAYRDLNSASRVIEFEQADGPGLLFANHETGMVGWVNTAEPDKSTYFAPDKGVDAYIAGAISDPGKTPIRDMTPEVAAINAATPPDHASNFHTSPEISSRSTADAPAVEDAATEDPEVEVDDASDDHER